MMERFLRGLLVLLGFGAASSCNNSVFIEIDEYGVPIVRYTVKGRVIDSETRQPIKGISISDQDKIGHTTTDDNGQFVQTGDISRWSTNFKLNLQDIDGEANGGKFAEKWVTINISEDDLVDKSTWVKGYDKEIGDIVLDKEQL